MSDGKCKDDDKIRLTWSPDDDDGEALDQIAPRIISYMKDEGEKGRIRIGEFSLITP